MVPPRSAEPRPRARPIPDGRERRRCVVNGGRWWRGGRDQRGAAVARGHRPAGSRPGAVMIGHMPVYRRGRATGRRGKRLRLIGGGWGRGIWRRRRSGWCRGRRRRRISRRLRLCQARCCRGKHRHAGRRGAADVIPHHPTPTIPGPVIDYTHRCRCVSPLSLPRAQAHSWSLKNRWFFKHLYICPLRPRISVFRYWKNIHQYLTKQSRRGV
jgi:hypothetical protein